MGLLYKDKKDVTVSLTVQQVDGFVELEFSADCGKFGCDELLSAYRLKPDRLLKILAERDDFTDDEVI